ncbi:MAG: Na(+)/H(+) antiporter subunit B [Clostridiales bacterium]|nr:Na(+)/H(+) antiporter subunit B [Clostridiales bacterium]
MKKIFAGMLVIVFGVLLLLGLSNTIDLTGYNDEIIPGSVADKYISKSVTEEADEIIFRETKGAETGSANIVTSVIVNYRSFDTLGEVTVLFLATIGIAILAGSGDVEKKRRKSGFILTTATRIIFPVMLITGIYIFTHGHMSAGGGFPGGSMIASSFLLLYMADNKFKLRISRFKIMQSTTGSLYVLAGITGLLTGGYFLVNFLPTGIVGELFSAGIIPLIYVLIGLKVGSEVTRIVSDMLKEEVSV